MAGVVPVHHPGEAVVEHRDDCTKIRDDPVLAGSVVVAADVAGSVVDARVMVVLVMMMIRPHTKPIHPCVRRIVTETGRVLQ